MKRYLLLAMLGLMTGSFVYAQKDAVKKVAILEVVDKADAVPYGVKLLLRTSLAQAIAVTPGFEGYDRVDMAAIQDEQDFQRTGLVSDDDIKRLGEMTGADYVLVAEVAKIDQVNIIITAKILNVETAKLEMTALEQSNTGAYEIEQSCRKLAIRLLNQTTINRNAGQEVKNKNNSKGGKKKSKDMDLGFSSDRKPATILQLDQNSKVFRKGSSLLVEDERMFQTKLTPRQVQVYMSENYQAWAQARNRRNGGIALSAVGYTVAVGGLVGVVYFDKNKDKDKDKVWATASLGVMIGGGLLGVIGSVLCGVQTKKMDVILKKANDQHGLKPVLNVGTQSHGLGLGLKF